MKLMFLSMENYIQLPVKSLYLEGGAATLQLPVNRHLQLPRTAGHLLV